MSRDFPGGPVIKNPPCNAGNTGLIPDLGRSHTPRGQLSLCPTTIEAVLEPGSHDYWSLRTATRESSHGSKDPVQPKINIKKKREVVCPGALLQAGHPFSSGAALNKVSRWSTPAPPLADFCKSQGASVCPRVGLGAWVACWEQSPQLAQMLLCINISLCVCMCLCVYTLCPVCLLCRKHACLIMGCGEAEVGSHNSGGPLPAEPPPCLQPHSLWVLPPFLQPPNAFFFSQSQITHLWVVGLSLNP